MSIECFALLKATESLLETGDGRATAEVLVESGSRTEDAVEAFAALCDDARMTELLRAEMNELPSLVVSTILGAWALAQSAGKQLRLESAPPSRPLEFARSRRVQVSLSMEDDGITVSLSHIPGRHAEWYGAIARVA